MKVQNDMKALYLDESGEHNPTVVDIHYLIFVLGGVIMDKDYADGPLTKALDRFKSELLGNADTILHTSDIRRNRNGFEALQDTAFRNRFYERMNDLMSDLRYSVMACAIRKNATAFRSVATRDLYLVCFERLVELFCEEIGEVRDGGIIIAENRASPPLNRALEVEWLNLRDRETRHIQARLVADRVMALNLRTKQDNIAGLQMADLVISPIGRHLLRRPDYEDWRIVAGKLRRGIKGPEGRHGIIVLA